jgi:beta-lactamase regulating signal transducer with metallopeptidase domain
MPTRGAERAGIAIAPTLAALLLAAWLAGIAWSLARLFVANAGLRRIVTTSRRSPALEDAYRGVIPAGVEILISPAFGPAAVGILHPKIILPRGMATGLQAGALRAVLLHEATHHRHRDVHVMLAQRLVEALFWWNPLMRLLGKASDAAREVACDVDAARAYGIAADYAEALLDSIAQVVAPVACHDARALHAAASLSTLEQRIDAIIEVPRPSGWANKATPLAVAAALVVLGVGSSLATPGIAVERAVDAASPVGMPAIDAVAADEEALLALHDSYSQSVHASHDRYSQVLERLTDAYTRELSALAEEPPDDGKDARLERLNERYGRLFADTESRFRDVAAQAETSFLATRNALALRGGNARTQ